MDNTARLCAFILCFSAYILFAYLLYWICEMWDKHSKRKCWHKIEQRRQAFAKECERAGKDLMLHDELERLKQRSVRFRPIRKAVGYFSDELAQSSVQ